MPSSTAGLVSRDEPNRFGRVEQPRTHKKLSYDPCSLWSSVVRTGSEHPQRTHKITSNRFRPRFAADNQIKCIGVNAHRYRYLGRNLKTLHIPGVLTPICVVFRAATRVTICDRPRTALDT